MANIFLMANGLNSSSDGKWGEIYTIAEAVFVTFLVTLIPELIAIGTIPQTAQELWVPFLSSLLMGIYTFMRMRNIPKPEKEDHSGE